MLVLTLKPGKGLMIGDSLVRLADNQPSVRLLIEAPRHRSISRLDADAVQAMLRREAEALPAKEEAPV
jgi:sRNA-binding carbon storage regulator CsrA